jgi:hypothetical protein
MAQKATGFKSVLPAVSAIALATAVSGGVIYLTGGYLIPAKQGESRRPASLNRGSVDLPDDGRFWRVHVLLRQ